MTPQLDPIMTVGEMAEYLKISRSKAYAMVARKEIPHIRIGKNVRIRLSDFLKWLEAQVETEPAYFLYPAIISNENEG